MPERLPKREPVFETEHQESEQPEELAPEESGVRKRPTKEEHAEEKERRQRLIIGSTKHIIKLLKEEFALLERIETLEEELQDVKFDYDNAKPHGLWKPLFMSAGERKQIIALEDRQDSLEVEIESLKKTYSEQYQTSEKPKEYSSPPKGGYEKRLLRLSGMIAKQEATLERERGLLERRSKSAPEQESA